MTTIAGDSLMASATEMKHIFVPLLITDGNSAAGSFALDVANMDPNLAARCECVNTATTGVLVSEQTFTGVDLNTTNSKLGFGLIDGLARGPVSGALWIQSNTGTGNAGLVWPAPVGFIGGISGQVKAGITTLGNVAVLITLTGGASNAVNAATGSGRALLHLFWR